MQSLHILQTQAYVPFNTNCPNFENQNQVQVQTNSSTQHIGIGLRILTITVQLRLKCTCNPWIKDVWHNHLISLNYLGCTVHENIEMGRRALDAPKPWLESQNLCSLSFSGSLRRLLCQIMLQHIFFIVCNITPACSARY